MSIEISKKENNFLLKIENVSKYYPGVVALDDVSFKVKKGEIHAIVGENGAGKTTLCNIITGICKPDKGKLYWKNKEVYFALPKDALDIGIRMVYQERNLISFLTGAQNICLGNEFKRGIITDEKAIYKKALEIRERLGTDVSLNEKVENLSPSGRQMIEILRAFILEPELLILDEPTSSLTEGNIKVLFKVIKNLKQEGCSIIFISHKINEIFAIADRVSIFRNGKSVHTANTSEISRDICIKYMINRELKRAYPEVVSHAKKDKILEIKNIKRLPVIKDISIHVNKGEVLGLYGLVGSGRTEVAEIIYGLNKRQDGEIIYDNSVINNDFSPEKAIKRGILLIPEDRKEHAIFHYFDIKKNITIPVLKSKFSKAFGLLKTKEERDYAKDIAELPSLRLKYRSLSQNLDELSGGNKQKVIIGRWIKINDTKLVIMDEPTQGIDVGTKYEIYVLAREFAKKGVSVIFISSELPELLGICDRMYVFRFGYVTKELQRNEFSEEEVIKYTLA